jgi:hypothetical protein
MFRSIRRAFVAAVALTNLSWMGLSAEARNFAPRPYSPAYGNPYWYASPSSYANPYWYGYGYAPYLYYNSGYGVSSGAGPAGNTPLPFGFGGYSFGSSGFGFGAAEY